MRRGAGGEGGEALAVVVQRYGADVTGGSESLARAVAERLAAHYRVTVFTTCARDYITWANELPPGVEHLGGVEVRRFPSAERRDLASFNALSEGLYRSPHGREEELDWLRRQGPYAPALLAELDAEKDRFGAILFFTYLYHPTWAGLLAAPERSILVPTAHDEPALGLGIFGELFAQARAFAFCSAPEEALVRSRFAISGRPSAVTGIGVEAGEAPDVRGFRGRHGLEGPYVLYAGRIDAGKGCAEMMDYYGEFRRRRGDAPELVLVGHLSMALPAIPGVRYLGYVGEEDKRAAMAGAEVLICSSPYESLSIVLLEGFSLGTPALANARSPVLRDHCVRSDGGLFYEDREEFVEALDLLVSEAGLRRALGANGRLYVQEHYRWDAVLGRYRGLIDAARGRPKA